MVRGAVGLRGVHRKWIMTEHLKHLKIPVLIVWGAQDRIIPIHHAYNAGRDAPRVKLCVLDQCGPYPKLRRVLNSTIWFLIFWMESRCSLTILLFAPWYRNV